MGVAVGCDGRVIKAHHTDTDGTDMSVPYGDRAVVGADNTDANTQFALQSQRQ